jgi:hypothetical protein
MSSTRLSFGFLVRCRSSTNHLHDCEPVNRGLNVDKLSLVMNYWSVVSHCRARHKG